MPASFSFRHIILVLVIFLLLSHFVSSASDSHGEELLAYPFLGFATIQELSGTSAPTSHYYDFSDVSVLVVIRPDGATSGDYIVRNETHDLRLFLQGFYLIGEEPAGGEYVSVGSTELWRLFGGYDFNRRPEKWIWYLILGWFAVFFIAMSISTTCLCYRKIHFHNLKKTAMREHDYDEIEANRSYRLMKANEREKWSSLGIIFHLFYLLHGPHGLTEQRAEEEKHLRGRFEKASGLRYLYAVRHYVGELIESPPVQTVLLSLLVLDIVLLLIEFTLEVFYPHSPGHHPPGWVEGIETAIYIFTVIILSILEIELLLLIFSFGLLFFTNPLYMMDLFVVTTALLIEVIFRDYVTTMLSSLLTLMRLWRIGRVVQAVFLAAENRHNQTKEQLRHLEEKLDQVHQKYRDMNKQRANENILGVPPSSLEAFS